MTTAVLSSKGQIVIPSRVRKKLGFTSGDQLEVSYDESTKELRLKKLETIDEMADRFTAFLKPGMVHVENASDYYQNREPRLGDI